jgi:hypothetical protein
MKTRAKVVASFMGCLLGLACSSSSQPADGSGGASATGGSATGGTGGTGTGGTGGTSTAGQGGSSGAGTGGAGTGGKAGSGTGGAGQGGAAGSTKAAGGAGGEGAGGAAGRAEVGGRGGGNAGTTGSGTGGVAGGVGSGGAAAGGSTGGGGSTSSGAVIPTTVASGRDQFAFGDVIFEVDPKVGARIGKLSLGGADMVVSSGTSTDQTDWGAVFWTSPQTAWGTKTTNWPPPVEFDKSAYTGSISGPHLVLDGPANATLGVSFSKDYSADSGTGWITVVYTIKASKALQAAPWENCRVPRGGLAFFPSGSSLSKGPLTMTEAGGIVWFDDKSKTATSASGEKAIADGSGGWMAYALNGNLLLRKFTDTPASAQAPKEGEDEIYPGSGFLELEVQGPYTSIAANDKLSWTVQWRIVKIPSTVDVSAGSATLAEFAKQQAGL